MPPRHTYWTILIGTAPTAFRAADRADLVPTFERLRDKHPEAVLKWFARGKLWDSPDAQREAERAERFARRDQPPRGAAWRPGGTHRDPRDRFKKSPKERDRDRRPRPDDRGRGDAVERRERGGPRERRPHAKPAWRPKTPGQRKPFGKPAWTPTRNARERDHRSTDDRRSSGDRDRRPTGDRHVDKRGFAPRTPARQPWRPKPEPPAAPPEPTKPDERVEQSRKGGTRLVKKIKR